MKIILNSLYIAFTISTIAFGQELFVGKDAVVSNVVIHRPGEPSLIRKTDTELFRKSDIAVLRALRYFTKTQNNDGSWGDKSAQTLATPLVLLSFLGRGEHTGSKEFGESVSRARTWVLNSSPTGVAERLASIVSLYEYSCMVYSSSHPEQKTNEFAKIESLLATMPDPQNDIWVDFAAYFSLPYYTSRPQWMNRSEDVRKIYAELPVTELPMNVDDYLKLYLVSLAKHHRGAKTWYGFNRQTTAALISRQQADGSYPVAEGQNGLAAAALATLRLEIYSQFEPISPAVKSKL